MTASIIDRARSLAALRQGQKFDICVIGGGATGLGIALDAASRGFKVALIDRQDFAAGTSSRSTKLIHGGVRYMRNPRDWPLVREALFERSLMLRNAPGLVRPMQFIVPCFKPFEREYYAAGVSVYTAMASDGLAVGYMKVLSAVSTMCSLPGIRRRGLKGGVQFLDAQFDDARMAVTLARTAAACGAALANYVSAERFVSDGSALQALVAEDRETGERFEIRATVYYNCAGPWVDAVRRKADVLAPELVRVSRGSHIMVDRSFMPGEAGMVIPKTTDGRILFCIPYRGMLEIGTTDIEQGQPVYDPAPTEDEIAFMIANANKYLARQIRREDVKAAFSGLRPLFNPTGARGGSTARVSREHAVLREFGNMITVTGGKWTSYRAMAEHALRAAFEEGLLDRCGCRTRNLPLADSWVGDAEALEADLLAAPDAAALAGRVRAFAAAMAGQTGARTAEDVLHRRLRIGQLDSARCAALMPAAEAGLADALGRPAA